MQISISKMQKSRKKPKFIKLVIELNHCHTHKTFKEAKKNYYKNYHKK